MGKLRTHSITSNFFIHLQINFWYSFVYPIQKVDSIEEQNESEKREEMYERSEKRCNSLPRSPVANTRRPRSPSPQRERYCYFFIRNMDAHWMNIDQRIFSCNFIFLIKIICFSRQNSMNYDPEEILSRSIQKQKNNDHDLKGSVSDPRRQDSADRYRSRSSFSDRF